METAELRGGERDGGLMRALRAGEGGVWRGGVVERVRYVKPVSRDRTCDMAWEERNSRPFDNYHPLLIT